MRIYLHGSEGNNWSLDQDFKNVYKVIFQNPKHVIVKSIFEADIVYSVWWNSLLNIKYRLLRKYFKKSIIATITNDLSHQKDELKSLQRIATHIVYANMKQYDTLKLCGFNNERLFYCPFYVDESIFKPLTMEREKIAEVVGIRPELIKDRFLVGSFQRDSLGDDLTKPKWQKNPDLLLDIVEDLNKIIPVTLVVAGPRRHYVFHECLRRNIEVIFVGDRDYLLRNMDDMNVNITSHIKLNMLYNLIDLYIVTSKSEGGPKSVIESAISQTPIISTDVGLANDFLTENSIFNSFNEAVDKALEILLNKKLANMIVEGNYLKASKNNNITNYTDKISQILESTVYA